MNPPFRILVVCSGNVCRSPLTERLLATRLAEVFGPLGDRLVVTSAGTSAMVGSGMDRRAAAVGTALGVPTDGFRARSLTAADVAEADLVLGATREHRAAAVRLLPSAHRRTFTLLEFARLCRGVDQEALPRELGERCPALVAGAASRRGLDRAAAPEDDDVPDPHGGTVRVHEQVGTVLDGAVRTIVAVAAGVALDAGESADAPPPRRTGRSGGRSSTPRRRGASAGSGGSGGRGGSVRSGRSRSGGSRRPVRASGHGRRRPAGRARAGRLVLRSALGVLGLLVLATGWLGVRGWQARGEMVAARESIAQLRTALLAGDAATATTSLADAQRRTARARTLTDDPLWRIAAAPPLLGRTPDAVRAVAATTDDLTRDTLPAITAAAVRLRPERLRLAGDRFEVAAFGRARPVLEAASTDLAAAGGTLDGLRLGAVPGPVARAVGDLSGELDDTAAALGGVTRAARLVPAMLGARGKRTYLVAFQNNAEARGTGGLLGVYALVEVEDGRIRVRKIGSNTDLSNAPSVPVNLGRDFTAQWGADPALWVNANLDPHFPYAARIWLALWKRQTGQQLDGVLATDPVALGYLLRATGPVTLPGGERLTSADAVKLTMSDVYARYSDNGERDAYLRSVARGVVQALVGGRGEPRALLTELGRAAGERRLLLYSTHPAEQREIARSSLAGTVATTPGPYAYVVVNNAAGSKMDYYLRRSIDYAAGECSGDRRRSRITVTFGNAARPSTPLPEYVAQRLDEGAGTLDQSEDTDAVVDLVSVYGPRGGGVVRATLDGKRLALGSGLAGGRPVWRFPLVVPAGAERVLVLDVDEPASEAMPVVPAQPLASAPKITVSATRCGR